MIIITVCFTGIWKRAEEDDHDHEDEHGHDADSEQLTSVSDEATSYTWKTLNTH